jgi:hypothetical protein
MLAPGSKGNREVRLSATAFVFGVVLMLAGGIVIVCDDATDPDTIRNRPTCFVTLEMPISYPVTYYFPQVLGADAVVNDKIDGKTIQWVARDATISNLRRTLGMLGAQPTTKRVLARLTLKGNFIWSANDPDRFLDGEAFGLRRKSSDPGSPTELRLPQSGDRRRGGDFEMWFYLTFGEPNKTTFRVTSVDFIRMASPPVRSSAGLVDLEKNKSPAVKFKAGENIDVLVIKFNRAIGLA